MKTRTLGQLNIFLIASSIILIGLKWPNLPPQIPLFYSRPWGEEQLAPKLFLGLLPLVCLITLLINKILANLFTNKGLDFFAQTCDLVSLATTILCLISLWKIIFLVT